MTGTADLSASPFPGPSEETNGAVKRGLYVSGNPQDYDRDHAVDLVKLFEFFADTQFEALERLGLGDYKDKENQARVRFLARLQGEISKRGVVEVLRHGITHGPVKLSLFYGKPSPGNEKAAERFAANIFSVTRQLRYSRDESQLALDLCLFINGLPVAIRAGLGDHRGCDRRLGAIA